MEKQFRKLKINIAEINRIFILYPNKKKLVQSALDIDKTALSKILKNKRKIEGGELLSIAQILEVDPYSLTVVQSQ